MAIKAFAWLMFSLLIVNTTFSVKGQTTDVIYIYELADELLTDTLDICPDLLASDFFEYSDENEVPQFGEYIQQFVIPFRGSVSSKYGMRRGRMHAGTDIKLQHGDTVVAVYDGVVTRAQSYYGYGRMVVISHSFGLETYYAHFSSILVRVGDTVSTGQPIGLGGRTGRATGTHLHFEIRQNGRTYNPEMVFDFENYEIKSEIEGIEMLADLVKTPRVTDRNHIVDMGDSPSQYVVRPGDSLWTISRRNQVTISELCELNNLTTKSILRIGMVLRLF